MSRTLSLSALLLLSTSTFAQVSPVPPLMNFQGRLTRSDGTPVADGSYSVRFSLWSALTGGTEKWNQTVNPLPVRNGTFAVVLSGFPAGTFNTNLFLEIKIGTAAPLTPRQQLVSVAYALKAETVKDNAITGASIANGSLTNADLAPGTLNPLAWLLNGNSGSNSASHFLGTTDNQALVFRTNNTERMRLSANGNLGIGTNSPANPLSVAGRANFDSYVGIGLNTAQWPLHIASTGGLFIGQDAATGGFTGLHVSLSAVSDGYASLQGVRAAGSDWGNLILNRSGGNVGIGTTTPVAKLEVHGDTSIGLWVINTRQNGQGVHAQAYGASAYGVWGECLNGGWGVFSNGRAGGTYGWSVISDARYKQHVATIENPLETILNLRGVTFDWKRDEFKDMNFTQGRQVGFIAQEVEPILPEIVHTDGKGYKSVIYANVVPVLVEAVKEQQKQREADRKQMQRKEKRLTTLEADNAVLKAENAALKARLDALTAAVAELKAERK